MSAAEERRLEEILETIYTEGEAGRDEAQQILASTFAGHAPSAGSGDLGELSRLGLVRIDGRRVALTTEGEHRARDLVRRHRLAERLFKDVLQLDELQAESHACELEHVLSAEATDSVCTLLGHPPTCPHGKAIPQGKCCGSAEKTIRPLVVGLPSFELGVNGRIVFIAPKFHDRMDRLAALGVIAGSEIRLHQRSPSFVIEVGETTLALDPEIAREIYVKRVEA